MQLMTAKQTIKADTHWFTFIDSPEGVLKLIATESGLRAVLWPGEINSLKLPRDMTENPRHPILQKAGKQITEYFMGERINFNLPLDLRGTPFQIAVWRSLSSIAYGSTLSYGQQATLIGHTKAGRAVGRANGCNPVPIVLPCHRVVGADNSLVGFSGGLDLKLSLLCREGVSIKTSFKSRT